MLPVYAHNIFYVFRMIDGCLLDMGNLIAFSVPSGAVVLVIPNNDPVNTYTAKRIYIDVNGNKSPNTCGRDVFAFVLGEDGHLYPYGTEKAAELRGLSNPATQTWDNIDASVINRCVGNNYYGHGCTARLIENNYKVDY